MWISHVMLGFFGLVFGMSVASASFALAVKLGIVPTMAEKSLTARHIITYENTIILGGICGNILSVFLGIRLPLGHVFLGLYGLGAGIFVGCMAIALAEILNAFTILFRRLNLKMGLAWVVGSIAFGKMSGCLYYFVKGFDS